MEGILLESVRIELLEKKVYLENKIEKLPIRIRKPIYQRIKRLEDSIKMIETLQLLRHKIKERIKKLEGHARTLRSQSRHRPRRLIKELKWVLGEIEI